MTVIINGTTGITNVNGTAAAPAETGTDTDSGIVYGTNTVSLATNGTTALTVDSSQNVGIGTASPAQRLHIQQTSSGASLTQLVLQNQDNAAGTASSIGFANHSNSGLITQKIEGYVEGSNAYSMRFYTYETTLKERMRIDSSGRVLINKTSTDGGQLNVQNSSTTTRAYPNATLRNSRTASTHYSVVSWNGSLVADAWIGQVPSTDALCFGHDAGTTIAESMRLQTSGELLLGTTSQVAQGKFGIAFVGGTHQAASFNETSGAASWTTVLFQRTGTTIGSISNATSSTAYNTSSDYRLKNTITPMTGALAKVQALKPVTYKWNIDNEDGEGFIAHELAEVCPNAVTGEKDAVDADGNPVYQGIDTSFLVATLTAAIQEQQALITALTARIEALENK